MTLHLDIFLNGLSITLVRPSIAGAASLDLSALKKALAAKEAAKQGAVLESRGNTINASSNGLDYSQVDVRKKFDWGEEASPDRFSLSGPQRVYFCAMIASLSLGFGRASKELAAGTGLFGDAGGVLVTSAESLATLLVVISIVSAIFNTVRANQDEERTTIIWAVKGLLGGPLAVRELVTNS